MAMRRKPHKKPKSLEAVNICYWCGRNVYSAVLTKKGLISLVKHTEHKIPYAFCQKHKQNNLVVSCSLCNSFKADKVFEDDEQTRYYLSKKWREKTHELFDVRQSISTE